MEREFTDSEIEHTENLLIDLRKNVLNRSSENSQVLNTPEYAGLKEIVMKAAETYCYEVMRYEREMKLRITQSWLNLSLENQGHHLHHHPNSFISGVLYLKCRKGDSIGFSNSNFKTLEPGIREQIVLNSDFFPIDVEAKDIVIFPSLTPHQVQCVNVQTPRISLAFNFFPYGVIGTDDRFSELILQ
jgi:uncharacterized protein (TIGR02466 family)